MMSDLIQPVKVLIFAGNPLVGPSINMLAQQNRLAGVILPEQMDAFSHQLATWLEQMRLPYWQFNTAQPDLLIEKCIRWEANLAVNFAIPHMLPESLLEHLSFYNFHPAAEYQGVMPLYWQIRDEKTETRMVLQKANVTKGSDDIAASMIMAIHPLDTLQCLEAKIAQQVPQLIYQLIEQGLNKEELLSAQPKEIKPAPLVQESDLTVNWHEMTNENICALARAGNAQFGGCLIFLGLSPINLLQATSVTHPTHGVKAGTICHVGEPEGVIIAVKNGALRIDILSNADGVFTGLNFTERFGISAGMAFENSAQPITTNRES